MTQIYSNIYIHVLFPKNENLWKYETEIIWIHQDRGLERMPEGRWVPPAKSSLPGDILLKFNLLQQ